MDAISFLGAAGGFVTSDYLMGAYGGGFWRPGKADDGVDSALKSGFGAYSLNSGVRRTQSGGIGRSVPGPMVGRGRLPGSYFPPAVSRPAVRRVGVGARRSLSFWSYLKEVFTGRPGRFAY